MPNVPLYQQIAGLLRSKIESGEWQPGDKLPGEGELAEEHEVSRNTIRDAVRWLKNLGLLDTQSGRGTFVVKRPEPFRITLTPNSETGFSGGEGAAYIAEVSAQGRRATTSRPKVEIHQADRAMAAALGVPIGELLVSRHQLRFIDEMPWSMQTSYYPLAFVQRGADKLLQNEDITPGTVAYLREKLGIVQASYTDRIKVRPPDENEIRFFDLPSNGTVQVYETNRTAYDVDKKPFRHTVSVFPADRNIFYIEVELPGIDISEQQPPHEGAAE